MNTSIPSTTFETRFPITEATLTLTPDWLHTCKNTLVSHGVTFEPVEGDIYTVLFPEGAVRIELVLTNPQQHRIVFPDGFSFIVIDPPREEGEQQQESQKAVQE